MKILSVLVLAFTGTAFAQLNVEFSKATPAYFRAFSDIHRPLFNYQVAPQRSCTTAWLQDRSGGFLWQIKDSVPGTTGDSAKYRIWVKTGLLKDNQWILGKADSLLVDSTASLRIAGTAKVDSMKQYTPSKGAYFRLILRNDRQVVDADTLFITWRYILPDFYK